MNWKLVHKRLVKLAKQRGALDSDEARWLVIAFDKQVHRRIGCGSFVEYLERIFGYTPRQATERLRVARSLVHLPLTRDALRNGELGWTAVRELSRVATDSTEQAWVDAATGKTAREIETMVAGHELGDLPTDPPNDGARRHILRFEVNAETYALMRDVQAKLRDEAGGMLNDDALLMEVARRVLGGPSDDGRASYQVATTVCARCERGWQDGGGEAIAVDAVAVETALCDAQHVGSTDVGSTHVGSTDVGSTDVGSGNDASGEPAKAEPAKATQTVRPAVRRLVLRRDHGRCVVPGCRSTRFLDVHHIQPRADGGDREPSNLACLCGAHHRAVHEGTLIIEGVVGALEFRHADRREYGRLPDVESADCFTKAFGALRRMGFKHSEASAAVARAREVVDPGDGLEAVIREAVRATNARGTESRTK